MATETKPEADVCLMCGQPLPVAARRVCSRCKKPILKGHRYRFNGSSVEHKNCEEPTLEARSSKR